MKMSVLTVLCAVMTLAAGPACATVITFSGATPGTSLTSYTEAGYTISVASSTSSVKFGGTVGNPDLLLPGATTINLTGGTFTLGTFQFGNVVIDNGVGNLRVYGFSNGVQTFDSGYVDIYQTLLSARDLGTGSQVFDRIQFASQTFSSSGAAIDSITVSAVGGVPEPASWAMMVAGFALLGAAMRRQNIAINCAQISSKRRVDQRSILASPRSLSGRDGIRRPNPIRWG